MKMKMRRKKRMSRCLPYYLLETTGALVAHVECVISIRRMLGVFLHESCISSLLHLLTCLPFFLLPASASPPARMLLEGRRVAVVQVTIVVIHHLDPHPAFLVTVVIIIIIIIHRILAV